MNDALAAAGTLQQVSDQVFDEGFAEEVIALARSKLTGQVPDDMIWSCVVQVLAMATAKAAICGLSGMHILHAASAASALLNAFESEVMSNFVAAKKEGKFK